MIEGCTGIMNLEDIVILGSPVEGNRADSRSKDIVI